MATHAHNTPAPVAAPTPLAGLIDAFIPLADDIMGQGSDAQQERLHSIILHLADLAIAEGVTPETARLKARAIRLIYAGHEAGMEDGLRQDSLDQGSHVERLALQVLSVMAAGE